MLFGGFMSNVFTSDKFLHAMSEQQRQALDEVGARVADGASFSDLDVPEPAGGESVLGELTQEEERLYVVMVQVKTRMEGLQRQMSSDALQVLALKVRDGTEQEAFNDPESLTGTIDRQVIAEYFRLDREYQYIHHSLYYGLSRRFDIYDHTLGVRSRRRVVRGARKW